MPNFRTVRAVSLREGPLHETADVVGHFARKESARSVERDLMVPRRHCSAGFGAVIVVLD